MNRSGALLCHSILMLLAASQSRPLAVETVKNNVKLLAQTTLVRIHRLTEEFRISPNMVFSGLELIPEVSLDKPIGLTSMVESLTTFQAILYSLQMEDTSQIQADIVSLQGIVRSLAVSSGCSLQKPGGDLHLDSVLKTNLAYHVTIGNVALNRLQRFLETLIMNLDQLKTC